MQIVAVHGGARPPSRRGRALAEQQHDAGHGHGHNGHGHDHGPGGHEHQLNIRLPSGEMRRLLLPADIEHVRRQKGGTGWHHGQSGLERERKSAPVALPRRPAPAFPLSQQRSTLPACAPAWHQKTPPLRLLHPPQDLPRTGSHVLVQAQPSGACAGAKGASSAPDNAICVGAMVAHEGGPGRGPVVVYVWAAGGNAAVSRGLAVCGRLTHTLAHCSAPLFAPLS